MLWNWAEVGLEEVRFSIKVRPRKYPHGARACSFLSMRSNCEISGLQF